VYCVVVWQRVIRMVCVLFGGVAACHTYGVCTVWWCGSMSYVWCVYRSQRSVRVALNKANGTHGRRPKYVGVSQSDFNVNFNTLSSSI